MAMLDEVCESTALVPYHFSNTKMFLLDWKL
jgi:hypothetical protein